MSTVGIPGKWHKDIIDFKNRLMAIICFKTCNDTFEANLIKTRLIDSGIDCFLTNENFTSLLPGYNGMVGAGIQIMIDDKDVDKANALLGQDSDTKIKCPNCDSENVIFGLGHKKFSKIILILLSLLIGTPFNNVKLSYYCKDCKTEFKR